MDTKIPGLDSLVLPKRDGFAQQLLLDAAEGLGRYGSMCGHPLAGNVLDIGAHYGTYTIQALAAGAKHVVCVEPAAQNLMMLTANMKANKLEGRVSLVEAAVWNGPGTSIPLRRSVEGNSGQYSVMFNDYHAIDRVVPTVTLDGILAYRQEWAIVKIDIEGGEWSFLTGPKDVKRFANLEFLDLEVHPLDAPGYFDVGKEPVRYVDEVAEWFTAGGARVEWTVAHPLRLFVAWTPSTP